MTNFRTVAFVGNCQAFLLSQIYAREIAPGYGQSVVYGLVEADLDNLLAADVIVEQILEAEPELYRRLPPGIPRVLFPTVGGRFLYPFGGQAHPKNPLHGPFDQERGDSFLNRMVRRGVSPEEALDRYLKMDLAREANLDRLFELHIELQRKRDQRAGISVAEVIEERFRSEKLFQSPGHAVELLANRVARAVFSRLGAPEAEIERALAVQFPHWSEHSVPLHPGVIRHFRLQFVAEDSRWPWAEEGHFTFPEWVIRYMNLEWIPELREGRRLGASDPARALPLLEQGLGRAPGSATSWRFKSGVLSRLGRLDEALAAANEALALQEDVEALLRACECRLAIGDISEAEALAERACTLFPDQAFAHLAWAVVSAGRPERQREIGERAALAIELQPYNPQVFVAAGQCLLNIGDLAGAEQAARSAMLLAPNDHRGRGMLAQVLDRQGRRDEALALLHQMATEATTDPDTHAHLGQMLVTAGDLAGAEVAFREAIELNPALQGIRSLLAEVLWRQGRRTEAMTLMREVMAGGTKDLNSYSRLGQMLAQLGDLAGAEAAFGKAIQLGPNISSLRIGLAEVLHRQGRRGEALVLARQVVAEGSIDPQIHSWHGQLLWQTGDLAGAETAFWRAIELDPRNSGLRGVLAEVLSWQGRRGEALALLQQVIAEGTTDPQIYARLGHVAAQSGDLGAAEAAFRNAIELDPNSQDFRSLLAEVFSRQGRRNEALALLRQLEAEGTNDPQTYSRLGHVLAQAGDLPGAEAAFRKAAELEPNVRDFRSVLADVLTCQGRNDEALAVLEQLAREDSNQVQVHARIGHLRRLAGDFAGAVEAFRATIAIDPSGTGFHNALADVLKQQEQRDQMGMGEARLAPEPVDPGGEKPCVVLTDGTELQQPVPDTIPAQGSAPTRPQGGFVRSMFETLLVRPRDRAAPR